MIESVWNSTWRRFTLSLWLSVQRSVSLTHLTHWDICSGSVSLPMLSRETHFPGAVCVRGCVTFEWHPSHIPKETSVSKLTTVWTWAYRPINTTVERSGFIPGLQFAIRCCGVNMWKPLCRPADRAVHLDLRSHLRREGRYVVCFVTGPGRRRPRRLGFAACNETPWQEIPGRLVDVLLTRWMRKCCLAATAAAFSSQTAALGSSCSQSCPDADLPGSAWVKTKSGQSHSLLPAHSPRGRLGALEYLA